MPKCGTQIIFCELPIRFDTYSGCSHACEYCFANRKRDISQIEKDEGPQSLLNFINGKRDFNTNWCDFKIPLHWGGMSDPFQPIEKQVKNSLRCLEILAKTKYPFVVSTKGILPMQEPYYSLFKECNCVFQVSLTCKDIIDRFEKGAPGIDKRLEMIEKMSKIVKRVIVRCQPYMVEYHRQIVETVPLIAKAGAYAITYEALKLTKKRKGMEKNGADFVYPKNVLAFYFNNLKKVCHDNGLVFLSAENRLREMGDHFNCCGAGNLEGFECNRANLNHYRFDNDNFIYTNKMKQQGTAGVFLQLKQNTVAKKYLKDKSYAEIMDKVLFKK